MDQNHPLSSLTLDDEIVIYKHWVYLGWAADYAESAAASRQQAEAHANDPAKRHTYWNLRHQEQKEATCAIIFAVIGLEAFINAFARNALGRFDWKRLDQLDLPGKWSIVTRLALGDGIDPSLNAVAQLDWLRNVRNELVHAKPLRGKIRDLMEKDRIDEQYARRALTVCIDACDALRNAGGNLPGVEEIMPRLKAAAGQK